MSLVRRAFETGICWGATVVFMIVALPLTVAAAVALRAVLLIVALAAGLFAAVLYCASARFRGWVRRRLGPPGAVPVQD